MPTYSYACTQCDNRFDVVQSFTDAALTVCDRCAGRLRKVFDSVGVVFKGDGFYRTDARNSGGKSSSGTKDAAKPAADTSSSSASPSSSDSNSSSSSASSSSSGSNSSAPAAAG